MNHPAGSAIDNQIVDAPDQNSEATGNPDLLSYSRDQHGIDIKIRSSSCRGAASGGCENG